jgi:hypothetical protein
MWLLGLISPLRRLLMLRLPCPGLRAGWHLGHLLELLLLGVGLRGRGCPLCGLPGLRWGDWPLRPLHLPVLL